MFGSVGTQHNPVPRKTVLGRSVGVRLSFFVDAFERCTYKN